MSDHFIISPQSPTTATTAVKEVVPVQEQLQNETDSQSFQNLSIQCKLSIGSSDDPLELEADTMADKVMRLPEQNFIQRKCTDCEEEMLQRKPLASFIQKKGEQGGMVASETVSNRINSSRGKGNGLAKSTKSFMESRFGTDFSEVNIHTGGESVQMNRELNAKAFTVGSDIYFNKGQYNPASNEGKHLLAHELTHTLQQKTHGILPLLIQREMLEHGNGRRRWQGRTGNSIAQQRLRSLIQIRPGETETGPWRIYYRWETNQQWNRGGVSYPTYEAAVARLPQLMRVESRSIRGVTNWYILKNSILRNNSDRRIFSNEEINRMKTFFVTNASQPNDRDRLSCINTVRSGVGALIYGGTTISGRSCPAPLRATNRNTMEETMQRFNNSGIAQSIGSINFLNSRSRVATGGSEPMTLQSSVWTMIVQSIGSQTGWSVFGLSLCDGYHSVIISVDHRVLNRIKMYWSDQTHSHPVSGNDRIPRVRGPQYGWERMARAGGSNLNARTSRGLDEYIRYAVRAFWFGSGVDAAVARSTTERTHQQNVQIEANQTRLINEEQAARTAARRRGRTRANVSIGRKGRCVPIVRIWRIQHAATP